MRLQHAVFKALSIKILISYSSQPHSEAGDFIFLLLYRGMDKYLEGYFSEPNTRSTSSRSTVRRRYPPWQCSRPGWMELWATWSHGRCPCAWQGGWNQMIFKVPSNTNHSMILWYPTSIHPSTHTQQESDPGNTQSGRPVLRHQGPKHTPNSTLTLHLCSFFLSIGTGSIATFHGKYHWIHFRIRETDAH